MTDPDWGSAEPEAGEVVWFGPLRLERTAAPPDGDGLSIPAGRAFGSGFHPSTKLLLQVLAERRPSGPVLDVGSGSGVLALAALRLGAPSALGVETDPLARVESEANARLNRLADRIRFAPALPEDAQLAFVMANILASELVELADELGRRIASGGQLWLSGIAETRAAEVEQAYRQRGYRVMPPRSHAGWCALEVLAPW